MQGLFSGSSVPVHFVPSGHIRHRPPAGTPGVGSTRVNAGSRQPPWHPKQLQVGALSACQRTPLHTHGSARTGMARPWPPVQISALTHAIVTTVNAREVGFAGAVRAVPLVCTRAGCWGNGLQERTGRASTKACLAGRQAAAAAAGRAAVALWQWPSQQAGSRSTRGACRAGAPGQGLRLTHGAQSLQT